MDKKTLPIIIALVILIMFWWNILEFLGLYERPAAPPPGSEPQVDTVQVADTPTAPPGTLAGGPTDQNWMNRPVDSTTSPDLMEQTDTMVVDTITVATERYEVRLSSYGGGPVAITLKDYTYRDGELIQMLPEAIAATPEAWFAGGTFRTSQLHYACNLPAGFYDATDNPLEIVYTYTGPGGAVIERKFTFNPEDHHFDLAFSVSDPSQFGFERKYDMVWNTPLAPTEPDLSGDYDAFEAAVMLGGSRDKLDDFDDGRLDQKIEGDVTWAGIRSKYFSAVLIPNNRKAEGVMAQGSQQEIRTDQGEVNERQFIVGLEMPFATVSPIADSFTVFVGPLDYMMMQEYDVDLEDMLDIGTLPVIGWLIKPFAVGIMWLLPKMYSAVPNYGVVIILFALFVKIITLPLSMKSFKSMQAMKELQPKMEEMKAKYKKDAQQLNKEMMKLYKQHGVNPMSGCLPMLPQMPLFFALFSVFRSTILLRDAPFVWFITDLSRGATGFTDPYIILVVLMVVAQFVSQKFTMASTQQNKALIYMMPLVMGFIFYKFSAGLVLYWTAFSIMALLDYVLFKRGKNKEVQAA
ncbi:MAG: membrane protein insertase YidC [bacterium]|nr:membrane protein insertase YidC [bacterium]